MNQLELTTAETIIGGIDSEIDPARTPEHSLSVRSFGLTDVGKVREQNEDQFLIAELHKALHVQQTSIPQPRVRHGGDHSHVFIVADGMGGHAGGEKASMLAVETVENFLLETFRWFEECRGEGQDPVLADFQRALGRANTRLLSEAAQRPELKGMGTTLTLAYCLNEELYVAHAGDSRCYLCREGKLFRLTQDHTLVEDLVRAGGLTAKQAARHPWRHNVTNAIGGMNPEIKVEVHRVRLESGDRLLLCSDGLTEMVPESMIAHVLDTESDPEQACGRFITYANRAGGHDNITAVVAYFDQPEVSTEGVSQLASS